MPIRCLAIDRDLNSAKKMLRRDYSLADQLPDACQLLAGVVTKNHAVKIHSSRLIPASRSNLARKSTLISPL